MAAKSFSRSRSTRRNKTLSGIDLPEVVPEHGLEVRPSERESYIAPQARYTDPRYASGLEAVRTEDAKEASVATVRDDTASTNGFFPSPSKPHNIEKQPFWRRKRARWWIIGTAFVIALLLAVLIAVAVTLSLSRRPSPPPASQTVTTTTPPSTTVSAPPTATHPTTQGCPSYTGRPLASLPSSLTRPGGPAPTPGNSNKQMTITFAQAFSYDLAATDQTTTSNAFTSLPQGFAYALDADLASSFVLNAFTPLDSTPQRCYIATVAQINLPAAYVAPLQQQARGARTDPAVKLWHNPNGNIADLFNKIEDIIFE